jgi:hypothetical protein
MNDARLPEKFSLELDDFPISILPRLPVISSVNTAWKSLQLACCQEPAFTIPEHCSDRHFICINGGKVVRLEQKIETQANTNSRN